MSTADQRDTPSKSAGQFKSNVEGLKAALRVAEAAQDAWARPTRTTWRARRALCGPPSDRAPIRRPSGCRPSGRCSCAVPGAVRGSRNGAQRRVGAVLGETWGEFDLVQARWTVPRTPMKARREPRLPLSARALEVLAGTRELTLAGSGFPHSVVFPAAGGERTSSTAFVLLHRRLGIDPTAHGFRSSLRMWAAERTKAPREVCEQALAHNVPVVEGRYQRSDLLEKRRALMERRARLASGDDPGLVVPIATAGGMHR